MYKDYEIKLNAILDKHGVQKVELENIKQLKENIKIAESLIKEAEKAGNKFMKEEGRLIKAYSEFMKTRNELNYHAQRIIPMDNKAFEKVAKKIGVDVSNIKELKATEKLQKKLMEYVKFYDSVKKYVAQV
jgi:LysM repeat protein